jgi:hypothetical protein
MTTPTTLLRDASLAGLVLAMGGLWVSWEFGGAVAAGAIGALLNMFLLARSVKAMGTAAFLPRLLVAHVGGVAVMLALIARLDALPVMIGLCAAVLGLAVRGFYSLASGAGLPKPPQEHA